MFTCTQTSVTCDLRSKVCKLSSRVVPQHRLRPFPFSKLSNNLRFQSRPSCSTIESTENSKPVFKESVEGENLKYWIIANGGVVNDNLKVVENAPCGSRGVICANEMTVEEVENNPLVLVPEELYLTSQVARVGFAYYEEQGAPSLAELDKITQLAILVAHEKHELAEESFYKPYIDILPDRPPCAWLMNDEELESALHAALPSDALWNEHADDWRKHVKSTKEQFHQHAQGVEDRYKDYFKIDSDSFLWGMGHVLSRSFSSHPQLGMAPFIDLLNHNPTASHPELVRVSEDDEDEEYFYYVTAARDGKAVALSTGQELHIKYHERDTPPREAFLSYGFVPAELQQ